MSHRLFTFTLTSSCIHDTPYSPNNYSMLLESSIFVFHLCTHTITCFYSRNILSRQVRVEGLLRSQMQIVSELERVGDRKGTELVQTQRYASSLNPSISFIHFIIFISFPIIYNALSTISCL